MKEAENEFFNNYAAETEEESREAVKQLRAQGFYLPWGIVEIVKGRFDVQFCSVKRKIFDPQPPLCADHSSQPALDTQAGGSPAAAASAGPEISA